MRARRAAVLAARVLAAVLSISVLVGVGSGWFVKRQLRESTVTSDALGQPATIPEGEPFTALLVGLDARTDASGNPLPEPLLDALHAGPDEGQLHTDTIILLRVPGRGGGPATAISIPRDSFVAIDGERGKHKINSAYRRGVDEARAELSGDGIIGAALERRVREAGRQKLVTTVQDLTGVRINHFAELNLAGFVELTEAIGGVQVCLNRPVRDSYSGIDLAAGEQTVVGPSALAFVRQRHGLDGGDLDRIARQQAFAAGLAQRLQDTGVLTDATQLNELVSVVSKYVVLDRGWDLDQAIGQLGRFTGSDLVFRTIPTGRPDLQTPVDGMAIEIDRDAVRRFMASVLDPAALDTTGVARVGSTATAGASASIAAAASPRAPATPTSAAGTTDPAPTTTPRVIVGGGIPCVD